MSPAERLRPADDVALVEEDGGVSYLARLPDGPVLVLPGCAAVVLAAALAGDRASLVVRVARATGATAAEVEPEADRLVDGLVGDGWLVTLG